jgi:hypothetical protein
VGLFSPVPLARVGGRQAGFIYFCLLFRVVSRTPEENSTSLAMSRSFPWDVFTHLLCSFPLHGIEGLSFLSEGEGSSCAHQYLLWLFKWFYAWPRG